VRLGLRAESPEAQGFSAAPIPFSIVVPLSSVNPMNPESIDFLGFRSLWQEVVPSENSFIFILTGHIEDAVSLQQLV
jgi:hypothetical protein